MSKATAVQDPEQEPSQETAPVKLTRDELRAALLGKPAAPKSVLITVFGVEIELRQPTLAAIMKTREESGGTAARAVGMIIEYAYVPGTDDHVFEDTDRDQILQWPFGEDLTLINQSIADLTGIDITAAMEDLEDPLGDSS